MSIFEKLQEIFRDIFDDPTLMIKREMTAMDIEDWDSLAQINIIVACEVTFKIKFEINEMTSFKNIGDMLDMIEKKTSQCKR